MPDIEIKFYNTLSRQKEDFNSIVPNTVGIYTCGPTVYNYAHIGNLRAYVFADVLKRTLEFFGYDVKHIINITDVGHLSSDEDSGEDKLEKGAKREHKTVWEIAKFYEQAFYEDLNKLNIEPATIYPKATDHIKEMIDLIKKLEEKGYTYVAGGNVYFDTSKLKDYGKLANLKLEPDETKRRIEEDPNKKNPFDFILWFTKYKYSSHEMQWDSPWGKGFPGWHIECSAMATEYLGEHFDIHTGGIDHIPVHHTNELAQSEAAFGHKWVNFWMHNEFLIDKRGEKMAKSGEEFLKLDVIAKNKFEALSYRYYLLTGHYRSPLQFSFDGLESARNSLKRARVKIVELIGETGERDEILEEKYLLEFKKALADDLNTAVALSTLWKVLDSKELSPESKIYLITEFDRVLALDLLEVEKDQTPQEIIDLAEKRLVSRKNGNWEEADKLRDEISKKGYEIKDILDGYQINKK